MPSPKAKLRKLAYDFVSNNRAAALATVGKNGIPHVVSIYCVIRKDLSLYFMTRVEGRKIVNLLHQPMIAMAFTSEGTLESIQLTGKAERVEDLKLEQEIWHELMHFRIPWADKGPVPAVQLFESGATNELAIIKVTPKEMTYANFGPMVNGRYKTFFQKII